MVMRYRADIVGKIRIKEKRRFSSLMQFLLALITR